MVPDNIPGSPIIVDIDGDETVPGEVVRRIGSAVVKRQGIAQEGIGQFFRQVMPVDVISTAIWNIYESRTSALSFIGLTP